MKTGESKRRLSILKEEGLFSLVIFPEREKWKLNLLFGWWIAWTLCGMVFIASYINLSNQAKFYRDQFILAEMKLKTKEKESVQAKITADIEKNEKQRLFLIGVLAFWAYYEYRVGRAYFFRKFGHEKIWIKNGYVFFKREINGRGKVKKFDLDFVKDFRLLEQNKADIFQSFSRSFWTLAGESLAFDYHSKTIPFGIQLDEGQAKEACEAMKRALKKAQAVEQSKENKK